MYTIHSDTAVMGFTFAHNDEQRHFAQITTTLIQQGLRVVSGQLFPQPEEAPGVANEIPAAHFVDEVLRGDATQRFAALLLTYTDSARKEWRVIQAFGSVTSALRANEYRPIDVHFETLDFSDIEYILAHPRRLKKTRTEALRLYHIFKQLIVTCQPEYGTRLAFRGMPNYNSMPFVPYWVDTFWIKDQYNATGLFDKIAHYYPYQEAFGGGRYFSRYMFDNPQFAGHVLEEDVQTLEAINDLVRSAIGRHLQTE